MRIVISNPDGIGDVVLRLPLFEALREAGHELLLICREACRPLLERLGGKIVVVGIRDNPYQQTVDGVAIFDASLFETVVRFSPDLLVFASYQWTVVEERLSQVLSGVARVRMNGHLYPDGPNKGSFLAEAATERIVEVQPTWHEKLKNQALCSAILSRDVVLGEPRLSVTPEDIERGRACLAEIFGGSSVSEEFWIGCMGNAGDYPGNVRDWGRDNWIKLLRYAGEEKGMRMVLVGNGAERESLEKLREGSGITEKIAVVTGEASDREGLSRLLGLTSLSCGYIGKDTGPMHMAAALQKPVVAVFGGGHWPQFTPLVTPSIAMMVDIPCQRCQWKCHLPESLCVKRVPVESMKEAVDAIASGRAKGREARLIAPSPEVAELGARRLSDLLTIGLPSNGERTKMSESIEQNHFSEAVASTEREVAVFKLLAEIRADLAVVKNQGATARAAVGEVERQREIEFQRRAELQQQWDQQRALDAKRIMDLEKEFKIMTQAAVEREREYARRDSEWSEKVVRATTQAHATAIQVGQLSEKLTAAERLNQELNAQAGRIGELARALHASTEKAQLLEEERKQMESRVHELSWSRSRRLLMKLRLVSRCAWEKD
jgi:ADP-heptose:LPS heptosyltransferase